MKTQMAANPLDFDRNHPPGDVLGDPVVFDDELGTDTYSGTTGDILIGLAAEFIAFVRSKDEASARATLIRIRQLMDEETA
jgi:hypothetical protein